MDTPTDSSTCRPSGAPTARANWSSSTTAPAPGTAQGGAILGTTATNVGQYLGNQQVAPLTPRMAVVVLTLAPIMLVYPFVQKHFAKGVLTGAIKG